MIQITRQIWLLPNIYNNTSHTLLGSQNGLKKDFYSIFVVGETKIHSIANSEHIRLDITQSFSLIQIGTRLEFEERAQDQGHKKNIKQLALARHLLSNSHLKRSHYMLFVSISHFESKHRAIE